MVTVVVSDEFKKQYRKLPLAVKRKAERREKLFRTNPFHQSLRTEKLEPHAKQRWSFRIDREYRIIFEFLSAKKVIFHTCGHHNWIYRYKL